MENNTQNSIDLTHHTDKMCLDKMQHTHGSFMTAGSTAYSIIKKIEYLFAEFKAWFQGILETVTKSEVHAMWTDDNITIDENGYIVGATIDDEGYLILYGFELTNDNYIKLK